MYTLYCRAKIQLFLQGRVWITTQRKLLLVGNYFKSGDLFYIHLYLFYFQIRFPINFDVLFYLFYLFSFISSLLVFISFYLSVLSIFLINFHFFINHVTLVDFYVQGPTFISLKQFYFLKFKTPWKNRPPSKWEEAIVYLGSSA